MRIRVVATLFLALFSSQFVVAQTHAPAGEGTQPSRTPTDQVPVIRTTTGEVILDMVVRDKHHHLVTDVRPNEVEIYEDGVRQDLKSFQLVQGAEQLQTERVAVQTPQTRTGNISLPGATSKNSLKQINFVSIVFAPTAPLNREFAREAVDDFLAGDSLPNTYVTIYTLSRNLNLVQPYTADKQVLTAVVDKISGNLSSAAGTGSGTTVAGSAIANTLADSAAAAASSSTPPSAAGPPDPMLGQFSGAIYTSPLWARNTAAVDASTPLGAGLEAQSLLWMSQRFDSSQAMSAMDSLRELIRSQEKLPGRKVVLYLSDGLALPSGRPEVFQGLISLANRTGVTFYTVDTRGLSVEDSTTRGLASMGMTGAESRQRGAVTSSVAGYKEMDDAELVAVSNTQLSMQELAESTGGFAVTNTNQIAEPMRKVMEDIRTHYELSYAPKSTTYDGHFRKIEVKLTRPKLAVQTRKGYFALPMLNGEPLQPYEAASLEKINARPMAADFHYDAAVMKFRSNENVVEYVVGFQIPATSLKAVPVAKSDKLRVQASIVAIVRDSNGEVADKISRELWRYVSPGQTDQRIFFSQPLVLPRGRYSV
ncbi:MAG TPA: VWA domain-containing protein, partial [Terriglobales bacterium]|nr:VWA domain-containing protein [Terriglobales bacterium]